MSKSKIKSKQTTYAIAIILLIAISAIGNYAAYEIGEEEGYKSGLYDGVRSTLLIEPTEECTVVRYDRGK